MKLHWIGYTACWITAFSLIGCEAKPKKIPPVCKSETLSSAVDSTSNNKAPAPASGR